MNNIVLEIALVAVPTVIAITLHEAAHGYAALAMGDDTARQMGRLSLNPLAHVDRVGTILLPGFLLISQLLAFGRVGFMFGWAKPVPVSAWKFRDPRRGMMIVAAAGPAMNFFLAWIGALLLYAVPLFRGGVESAALELLTYFMLVNVVLGVFNLIPLPPLDGGRIIVGLLPLSLAQIWARIERYGIVLVLALLFIVPSLARHAGYSFDPIRSLLSTVALPLLRVVLALAGHPPLGTALLSDV